MEIKVLLEEWAYIPEKAYDTDAGFDIRTPDDLFVPAHGSAVVDTGVHMVIPRGYCGLLVSKSGLNMKHCITTTGLVDAEYTGSIKVKIYNDSDTEYWFHDGDKITQIMILPVPDVDIEIVDELPNTRRAGNGFGSSGK